MWDGQESDVDAPQSPANAPRGAGLPHNWAMKRAMPPSISRLLPTSIALAGLALIPGADPSQPQETEPPLKAELRGLGKTQIIHLGLPFTVELEGKTHQVSLDLLPTRQLCVPGICFDYPSYLTFEFDPSGGSKSWTLSGNDLTVMIQVNPIRIDLDEFAGALAEALGNLGDGTIHWEEAPPLSAEGLRIAGRRVVIPWGDMEFRTSIYGLLHGTRGENARTFIMVQEVRDSDQEVSEEVVEFHRLLTASLSKKE